MRGEIRMGPTVKLAYVDQSRHALDDKKTVWQEISGGLDILKVGNYETPSRSYVGRFNFKGSQQQQTIGELSGGERNRVHLAKVLKSGGNVLLLDEPTNDLDIETLRALEEALLGFPGLRRRDLARPLVPRSHRDPHPRLRGRLAGRLVRGQLPGVRRGLQAPQGRGSRATASHPLQAPHPVRRSRSAGGAREREAGGSLPWIGPLAALVVFGVVAYILHGELARLHFDSVFAHLSRYRADTCSRRSASPRSATGAERLRRAGAALPAQAAAPMAEFSSPPSSPAPLAIRSASPPLPAGPSASVCMPARASPRSRSQPSPHS